MQHIPVDILQMSLNTLGWKLAVDGDYGPKTRKAVIQFQAQNRLNPDGIVGPKTAQAITNALASWTKKKPEKSSVRIGLTEEDYQDAADMVGLTRPHIKAVVKVEANGSGWFTDIRATILDLDGPGGFIDGSRLPKILFEALWFHRLTGGIYTSTHPNISSRTWNRTLYLGGQAEYTRLHKAMMLNPEAALKSTSWGSGQIMGFNHKLAGYPDVFSFVDAMKRSERDHLMALVNFIKNSNLVDELKRKDWAGFARQYNGPGYAANNYHTKLEAAYRQAGGI